MTELTKQKILDELKEHRDMEGSTANGYARDILTTIAGMYGKVYVAPKTQEEIDGYDEKELEAWKEWEEQRFKPEKNYLLAEDGVINYVNNLTITKKGKEPAPASNNTKMNKYKALISYLSWWDSPHRKRGKAVSTEKGLEKQADRTELTIAKGYEELFGDIKKQFNELNTAKKQNDKNHVKSEKQKDNWLEWKEVLRRRNIIDKQYQAVDETAKDKATLRTVQRWVVAHLYTDIAPERLEYATAEWVEHDKKDLPKDLDVGEYKPTGWTKGKNYLVIRPKKRSKYPRMTWVMADWKEQKTHGVYKEEMPLRLVKKFMEWRNWNKSKYVFLQNKLEPTPLTNNGMTKLLKSIFSVGGKDISVNMLRHIWATNKDGEVVKQLEKNAKAMKHDLKTHIEYVKT